MAFGARSLSRAVAKYLRRDAEPYCVLCRRKMLVTEIEPLLTARIDVVTFTCRQCAGVEKRARRRPPQNGARR
jgi:hypothetical protein